MSEPKPLTWAVLGAWLSSHSRPYWIFDLDGTLIDLAARPSAVSVSPRLIASLERLNLLFEGRVAIISGRALADLESLLPLPLTLVGNHGAEFRHRGARWEVPQEERVREALDDVRPPLRDLESKWRGSFLEDKGPSISFHVRGLKASEADACVLELQRLMERRTVLRLHPGQACWEIRPGQGPDKGQALEVLLASEADAQPLVFGDDVTDEDAFRAAALHQSLTVIVGPRRPTLAERSLGQPRDLRDLLDRLTS